MPSGCSPHGEPKASGNPVPRFAHGRRCNKKILTCKTRGVVVDGSPGAVAPPVVTDEDATRAAIRRSIRASCSAVKWTASGAPSPEPPEVAGSDIVGREEKRKILRHSHTGDSRRPPDCKLSRTDYAVVPLPAHACDRPRGRSLTCACPRAPPPLTAVR